MARTVTLQSIADKARFHSDMKSSGFVTDAEILSLINDNYCDLYDQLVGSYENYYTKQADINIGTGADFYDLPDDFYKMLGVDFRVNNDAYITLRPFDEAERNVTLTTNVNIPSGSLRIFYVPAPTVFTSLSDTFDGVAGWDRLVSLAVAIDMLDAEESDSTNLQRKYKLMFQRIQDMDAPRDAGFPATVADAYKPNIQYIYGALMYRLYGDQIRLINTEFLGADMFPPFY